MRIMVVDESAFVRKKIRQELETGDFEVIEATNGREALIMYDSEHPALVTLGAEMEGMDGFEICERIRALETASSARGQSNTPLLFVTSYDTLDGRERGFAAGATDFITKPFADGAVLAKVREILHSEPIWLGVTALVAEDSDMVRKILTDALQRLGVTVLKAADGREALEMVRENPDAIDMVLTDLNMPHLNGKELCKTLRGDLGMTKIPIIIISAQSEKNSVLELFKDGATDYMIKPFSMEELLARVKVHLDACLLTKHLSRQNQEMQADLDLAREVQQGTLHSKVEADYMDASVVYRPFGQVSGDIYDFSITSKGEFSTFFGDATGHGVGAAFMTMMVQTGLDSIGRNASTEEVLTRLHHLVYERTGDQYVTGMIVRITPEGEATHANAGHVPMVILPKDSASPPRWTGDEGGLPLGILKDPLPFGESSLQLNPGDRLFLMSDGIIEWSDPSGELFEADRFMDYLACYRAKPLQDLVNGLVEEATRFSGGAPCQDDLTLIGLQYR